MLAWNSTSSAMYWVFECKLYSAKPVSHRHQHLSSHIANNLVSMDLFECVFQKAEHMQSASSSRYVQFSCVECVLSHVCSWVRECIWVTHESPSSANIAPCQRGAIFWGASATVHSASSTLIGLTSLVSLWYLSLRYLRLSLDGVITDYRTCRLTRIYVRVVCKPTTIEYISNHVTALYLQGLAHSPLTCVAEASVSLLDQRWILSRVYWQCVSGMSEHSSVKFRHVRKSTTTVVYTNLPDGPNYTIQITSFKG